MCEKTRHFCSFSSKTRQTLENYHPCGKNVIFLSLFPESSLDTKILKVQILIFDPSKTGKLAILAAVFFDFDSNTHNKFSQEFKSRLGLRKVKIRHCQINTGLSAELSNSSNYVTVKLGDPGTRGRLNGSVFRISLKNCLIPKIWKITNFERNPKNASIESATCPGDTKFDYDVIR